MENTDISEILTSITLDQQLKTALLSLQQGKNKSILIIILIYLNYNNLLIIKISLESILTI